MKRATLFAIFLLPLSCTNNSDKAGKVAARLVLDTSFELEKMSVPKPLFPVSTERSTRITISEPGVYILGYNYVSTPKEVAYDCYDFENYSTVQLPKGDFGISGAVKSCKYFGLIDKDGRADPRVKISVYEHNQNDSLTEYRLKKNSRAAFNKHPYAEWHYANGATLSGLRYYAETFGRDDLIKHIDRVVSWNLDNAPTFKRQYDRGSPRTQNYRLFRCAMLDDAGAPSLPYAESARYNKDPRLRTMVDSMAVFVRSKQHRLADGTFARPEPKWTVWCDDLFMGCSLLTRYYDLTEDTYWLSEAARQAELFYAHLYDKSSGLLYHAWNDTEKRHLGEHWGRANGWFIWAISDILIRLDEKSDDFQKLLTIHNSLLRSIISHQAESGLWHQVIDHPETYEETSASCAFIFAIARAVRSGWISRWYMESAIKGWKAIEGRVSQDGVLSGICRSMSIQKDIEGYNSRETAGNDPRGLGMFFMAAAEMHLLEPIKAGLKSDSERIIRTDTLSGREIWQVSQVDSCLMPYFENQAFTYDDKFVVFESNRDGGIWKLYASEMESGKVFKLSDREVEGRFSIYNTGNEAVFMSKGILYAVNVESLGERVLFDANGKVDEPMVSCCCLFTNDGDYTTLKAANPDNSASIYRIRISTGEIRKLYSSPYGMDHPMINPEHPNLITYVCKPDRRTEWNLPRDERARAMLINTDDGSIMPFVVSDKPRKATHESWSSDGERLFYIEKARREDKSWDVRVVSIDKTGSNRTEHYINNSYKLAHGAVSHDGRFFVCDVDKQLTNPLYLIDFQTGEARIVCWPDQGQLSAANTQSEHVHPLFSHSGRYMAFTSDRNSRGIPQAFVVPIKDLTSK